MQKLQLSGLYGEFGTGITHSVLESNADFDVKKMREMLKTAQGRMIANSSFGAYGKEQILKSLTGVDVGGYRKALQHITDEFCEKVVFTMHKSAMGTINGWDMVRVPDFTVIEEFHREQSAWREFIETKGPVDDGVSWLFRKSLVSMAVNRVINS